MRLLNFLGMFLAATMLGAQSPTNQVIPAMPAIKVDALLQVDGVLDEPFWKEAPVGTGFIDTRTQQLADQQTSVRVAYSQTDIYIAVECFDDKISEIRASERREDRAFTGDDWVEIHFDPPHGHRGKYAFFSNPLGTKADANEGPSGVFNYGWSAQWECAAQILSNRWVFEMKIPFGIMNYQRKDAQTWGFNVTRALRRTDTISFWSFSVTDMYKPRYFGHLQGLNLADTKFTRNWETTPYVSTRVDFNGQTKTVFNTGVDTSFRLTPSVTTAWTLHPDFGQVEADDDTIELRDTERFLSEKRLFFREGEELMRMPQRLYYSRRFTDIDGGGKVNGQWPGFNLFAQNLYSTVNHDGRFNGNHAVLRLMQNVGERSSLMYYVNDSELEHGHSRVVSTDGILFLNDDWRWVYQVSLAADRRFDDQRVLTKDRTDFLGDSMFVYSRYPWQFEVGGRGITKEFNPLLGYIPRRNIFGPSFVARYLPDSSKSWYKRLRLTYEFENYWNDAAATALHDHSLSGSVVFPNDLGIYAGRDQDYHPPYHNPRTRAGFQVFASDYWKLVDLGWAGGRFENTRYNEVSLLKPFKIWERLPIRYELALRFEDRPTGEQATVWLNRVVLDLYLTDKMWIKSSVQHRHDSIHNISFIYGWEFLRNTHWYLVLNSVNEGASDRTDNSVFSKITHTF